MAKRGPRLAKWAHCLALLWRASGDCWFVDRLLFNERAGRNPRGVAGCEASVIRLDKRVRLGRGDGVGSRAHTLIARGLVSKQAGGAPAQ